MINDIGLSIIKQFETCRLAPYKDQAGNWTVGWGHLLQVRKEASFDDVLGYLRGRGEVAADAREITQELADRWLQQDVAKAAAFLAGVIRVDLTDNQRSALVSFVFNIGGRQFVDGSVDNLINDGKLVAVPWKMQEYVNVTDEETGKKVRSLGLTRRRAVEAWLFGLDGDFQRRQAWTIDAGMLDQAAQQKLAQAVPGSVVVLMQPVVVG